jgi:hypothetical protein
LAAALICGYQPIASHPPTMILNRTWAEQLGEGLRSGDRLCEPPVVRSAVDQDQIRPAEGLLVLPCGVVKDCNGAAAL